MARRWIFLVMGLAMVSFFPPPATAGFAEDCERLAADPEEPSKTSSGVALENIESRAAWMACAQAVRGPIGAKPGSRRKLEPEPETTYRLIRASLADGPAQDIWQAINASRLIAAEAKNAPDRGRLSPKVVEWYVERGRQYYRPATYLKDAEAGNAGAQMALYYIFADRYLQSHDPDAASQWYAKALAQEHREALTVEGLRRLKAANTPEQSMEAVKLIVKAAMRDYAGAQRHLGELYIRGEHIPKNRSAAKAWFSMAADRGDTEAAIWLRNMETDKATVVIGSILTAMIAAAIIDGLADEDDIPRDVSDEAVRKAQDDANSRMGNCRAGYSYNVYSGYCENYLGNRQ